MLETVFLLKLSLILVVIGIIGFLIYKFWNKLNPANWFSDTYGRGAGYAYIVGQNTHLKCVDDPLAIELRDKYGYTQESQKTKYPEEAVCEWSGGLFYPKCKPGYKPSGCCLCKKE